MQRSSGPTVRWRIAAMAFGRLPFVAAVVCALLVSVVRGEDPPASAADAEDVKFFEEKTRPVLVEHCYECHSSRAKVLGGSLSVESPAAPRKGGDQGPAVVPGDLEQSLIIRAIRYQDD